MMVDVLRQKGSTSGGRSWPKAVESSSAPQRPATIYKMIQLRRGGRRADSLDPLITKHRYHDLSWSASTAGSPTLEGQRYRGGRGVPAAMSDGGPSPPAAVGPTWPAALT